MKKRNVKKDLSLYIENMYLWIKEMEEIVFSIQYFSEWLYRLKSHSSISIPNISPGVLLQTNILHGILWRIGCGILETRDENGYDRMHTGVITSINYKCGMWDGNYRQN
jgi:hypothetical protein